MPEKGKETTFFASKAKKDKKDLDDDDLAFKAKQQAEAKAKQDMAKKLAKK